MIYKGFNAEAQRCKDATRCKGAKYDHAFSTLQAGVVFRQDIPVKERKDWEGWLDTQRTTQQQQHTANIVQLETMLNAQVYALFGLTPAEILV